MNLFGGRGGRVEGAGGEGGRGGEGGVEGRGGEGRGGEGRWVNFLDENESHIYPNMCAKFGCGPTVVSKKLGYRQTDRQRETADLYNRL